MLPISQRQRLMSERRWGTTEMPKGPKGQKRPADVIGNAVRVMRIATGEESESPDRRNQAAVALSKLGASKGGQARAKSMSKAKRVAIAKKAATSRFQTETLPTFLPLASRSNRDSRSAPWSNACGRTLMATSRYRTSTASR
jgi:hypothetical protein